ncbi:phage portal protein, putative, A118 family [Streptoalloteichus tenebrarius]|uniref:Phage portal protein, putative, A118 family n=1 Tax=Streptoalloteichus tenebrarius (strain ATCC 17920 / DSM 40477 / JCM 4838 / CBS 697.72 / NBRC 16177 / NCIMB 11028 / NRRL B-12390 / A12253. 1 / ISP 5477) TaxID=1933 RepID=A0ABT1I005_STRSD|nr:phage portal protein [Streptoalloteichus tenebrarius]MCP2261075.1 phage portal protein, putative, A118 family [Streptoalloteichus tenebrarius]BFF03130.1 hypothetical protein GCM10020241_48050 [Streptoalloteichus tenebrarius]
MPLPAENSPWPPREHATNLVRLREYDAWYAGDPDRLTRVYSYRLTTAPENRPSQYRGGVVGRLARWWWGQPTPAGERRSKIHVPLPADIASISSDLLFAEPPTLTWSDTATAARWENLTEDLRWHAQLSAAGELGAAFGVVFLRVDWDTSVADHPVLSVVRADHVLPEYRWGMLRALTAWTTVHTDDSGSRVMRHLQQHEMHGGQAITLHGLYEGTQTSLGNAVPLDAHPATRGLAPVVETGLPMLPVVDVPNMAPSRLDPGSSLGRSDFEGPLLGLFDAIDEVYSSWMRDVRLAKARVLLPDAFLSPLGPGQGAMWDEDREVYAALNIPPTSDGSITLQQFAIRVREHRETVDDLVRRAVEAAGYAAATFGLTSSDGGGAMTATEVVARERRSFVTRQKKINYWSPALRRLAAVALHVDQLVFGRPVTPEMPRVEWPDGVSESPLVLAQTIREIATAEAASIRTRVELLHPDWDTARVDREVAAIRAEQGADIPDPVDTLRATGGVFGEDQEDDAVA